jgi:hypothetical protein
MNQYALVYFLVLILRQTSLTKKKQGKQQVAFNKMSLLLCVMCLGMCNAYVKITVTRPVY